jgi:hypothetical protein
MTAMLSLRIARVNCADLSQHEWVSRFPRHELNLSKGTSYREGSGCGACGAW